MDNKNFTDTLNKNGCTMYELSAKSGVKYSIVHNLYTGKTNINNSTAETIYKLSKVLEVPMDSLLNPIMPLVGTFGHVGKTKYVWAYNKDSYHLVFKYNGKQVELNTEHSFIPNQEIKYAGHLAKVFIDDYIKKESFREKWEKVK